MTTHSPSSDVSQAGEVYDGMDKDNAIMDVDEIRWLVSEGTQDLLKGE